ncbi:MAG: hypothetical protein LCH61_09615 [Proteobacteria bacterium]|nr:hypothetical protein [Pseudomonadota bacterium]
MNGQRPAHSMVTAMQDPETGVLGGTHAAAGENSGDADLFAEFEAGLDGIGGVLAPPKKRGPGRPPGKADFTTVQMKKLMAARGYRDPMEVLAAISSADPVELADALCAGLSLKAADRVAVRVKVLGEIRKAAADRMPYEHRRMPQQIEVQNEGAPRTLVVIGNGPTQVNVANGQPGEQNQALSVHAVAMSDGIVSDAEEKA